MLALRDLKVDYRILGIFAWTLPDAECLRLFYLGLLLYTLLHESKLSFRSAWMRILRVEDLCVIAKGIGVCGGATLGLER
jgi:hypothetical protein